MGWSKKCKKKNGNYDYPVAFTQLICSMKKKRLQVGARLVKFIDFY
jgi:hypothetical protein